MNLVRLRRCAGDWPGWILSALGLGWGWVLPGVGRGFGGVVEWGWFSDFRLLSASSHALRPDTVRSSSFGGSCVGGQGPHRHVLANPMPILAVRCDVLLPDCNHNGRGKLCDLIEGLSADLNVDGIPDDC